MPEMTDGSLRPAGYQQIVGAVASTALTVPTGARIAIIQATSQNVRWRDDGTAPTASIGIQLAAGEEFMYNGSLKDFRFIQEAATTTVNVSYYY